MKPRKWMLVVTGCALWLPPVPNAAAQASPEKTAWGILKAGASEKSTDKRTKAVRALGLLPQNRLAQELAEKSLADEKPDVRAAAALALGEMNSKTSIPKLKDALKDSDTGVVLAAAHSLYLMKDDAAYEVYYAVLTGERKSKGSMASEGMKTLKDPGKMAKLGFEEGIGFVPFAGVGYGIFKLVTKDDVSPVRAAAAAVLANDPDDDSGQALAKATLDKSWIVRTAALSAIAKRGDPGLLPQITRAMSDEKDIVQYTAAAAVAHLSDLRKRAGAGSKR